jgi:carboxylesterase
MNAVRIQTLQTALPVRLEGTGDTAVLLLHGFSSYPGIMAYLAPRLHEAGFTVAVPRLPGHGTHPSDFVRTGARDWLRRATDEYLDLAARYPRVCIAGLSMGALLALMVAAEFPVVRLGLMAPAIVNTKALIHLTPIARYFVKRLPSSGGENLDQIDTPDHRYLEKVYWRWYWISPVAEFHRLQIRSRRAVKRVTCPTLLIHSRADETVPARAASMIRKRISARTVRLVELERSHHRVVVGEEKARVADELIAWFAEAQR